MSSSLDKIHQLIIESMNVCVTHYTADHLYTTMQENEYGEVYLTKFPRETIKELFVNEKAIKLLSDYYTEDSAISPENRSNVFQSVLKHQNFTLALPPTLFQIDNKTSKTINDLFGFEKKAEKLSQFDQRCKIASIVGDQSIIFRSGLDFSKEESKKTFKSIRRDVFLSNVSIDETEVLVFILKNVLEQCVAFNNNMEASVKAGLLPNPEPAENNVQVESQNEPSIHHTQSIVENLHKKRAQPSVEISTLLQP